MDFSRRLVVYNFRGRFVVNNFRLVFLNYFARESKKNTVRWDILRYDTFHYFVLPWKSTASEAAMLSGQPTQQQ